MSLIHSGLYQKSFSLSGGLFYQCRGMNVDPASFAAPFVQLITMTTVPERKAQLKEVDMVIFGPSVMEFCRPKCPIQGLHTA